LLCLLHMACHVCISFFFFLPLPPPPTSTLFPYTTLFRSLTLATVETVTGRYPQAARACEKLEGNLRVLCLAQVQSLNGHAAQARSEEHTSELQSLAYLVCRLLLEKKNNKISHITIPVIDM